MKDMFTPIEKPVYTRMVLIRLVCDPDGFDENRVVAAVDELGELGTVAVIFDGLERYYKVPKEQEEYGDDEYLTAEEEEIFREIEECTLEGDEVYLKATNLNDNVGLTFNEIAQCVRYTFRSFL